ncbi:MAG TPA: T9SS type A sorting domain-containing protein [bacterium]|nr:T9SS type A sorting domain-containing protein [bacterium]
MRNLLCLVLIAPLLALAAGKTQLSPTTDVVRVPTFLGGNLTPASPAQVVHGGAHVPARALVGTIDTIGGTTFDWWANGPIWRMIVNSPGHGVHVTWMYCNDDTGQTFPSRRMYYNFYDYSVHAWNWLGQDFMADDGIPVFPASLRTGYGNIAADSSGAAVVSCHRRALDTHLSPRVARDAGSGLGIFSYCDSVVFGSNIGWPPLDVGGTDLGTVHIFPIESTYVLEYSHSHLSDSWPHFSAPVFGFDPNPGFPTQNIAASKVSNKVALTWVIELGVGSGPQDGYVDFSTDGGKTWGGPTKIDTPSAYAADSARTSFDITSIFPYYDRHDRFHIVADLLPCPATDTIHVIPAEIWHYCPDNTPHWSLISVATTSTWPTGVTMGYNAAMACRPSIGEDSHGNLFVTWEQFDSLNYEPTTNRMRADIFASASSDNGLTWAPAAKLTDAGSYSMRFPSVIDYAIKGDANSDTMAVIYEEDSIAGFYVAASGSTAEGAASHNPVVVQKIPVFGGIAEQPSVAPVRLDAAAKPNPFEIRTRISYSLPRTGDVSLVVYDVAGRPVQTLASGHRQAGRYTATWDARNVAAGVYFCTLTNGKASTTRKLMLTR